MTTDNNDGSNVVPMKPTKSFKDVIGSINGQLTEARMKAVQSAVKEILDRKVKAEQIIKGCEEELLQLEAKFSKGLI